MIGVGMSFQHPLDTVVALLCELEQGVNQVRARGLKPGQTPTPDR
jgi:hypothetical protein